MLQNKQAKGGEAKYYINRKELERIDELKYLERILGQDDDNT